MTTWPILSVVTFLPAIGALMIYLVRGDDEAAQRNSKWIELWTTLVTFAISLILVVLAIGVSMFLSLGVCWTAFGWRFTDYAPAYAGIQSPEGDGEVGGLSLGQNVEPGGPLVLLYSDDLDVLVSVTCDEDRAHRPDACDPC